MPGERARIQVSLLLTDRLLSLLPFLGPPAHQSLEAECCGCFGLPEAGSKGFSTGPVVDGKTLKALLFIVQEMQLG